MRIRKGARKGREDEETDSTIVGAMGRKDGRGKKKRLGLWKGAERWAPRGGAGETKRG